jgi:hypothetical protein
MSLHFEMAEPIGALRRSLLREFERYTRSSLPDCDTWEPIRRPNNGLPGGYGRISSREHAIDFGWAEPRYQRRMSSRWSPGISGRGASGSTERSVPRPTPMNRSLRTLRLVPASGLGERLTRWAAAAVLPISGNGRVLVYSFASPTSGTPRSWAATPEVAGVNLLTAAILA